MKKIKKLFFIKEYNCGYIDDNGIKLKNTQYYCYYCEWTVKIVNLLFLKTMYIGKNGYSISIFNNKVDAMLFIKEKRNEYINAKKYIKI